MNLKKAGVIGVILWVIIFLEVSLLNFTLISMGEALRYSIHYIFLALITIIGCNYYFNKTKERKAKKKAKEKIFANPMEGIKAGVIFIATGIILDVIVTVPFFMQFDYTSFFMDYTLLIGYLEILIIGGIIGAVKEKRGAGYYKIKKK